MAIGIKHNCFENNFKIMTSTSKKYKSMELEVKVVNKHGNKNL